MAKTTFVVFCPQCNMLVESKVIAEGNAGFRQDAVSPIDVVDSEYYGDHYLLCV